MDLNAILERHRNFARQRGWSVYRLSLASGFANNSLQKMYKDNYNPSFETLQAVECFIDLYEAGKWQGWGEGKTKPQPRKKTWAGNNKRKTP